MRKLIVALTLAATFVLSTPALAGSNVQSPGKLGVGLHLGYPGNGVSLNWFLTQNTSLQVDAALWLQEDWFGLGGRVDYLFWMPTLTTWDFADLKWYWGPGANVHQLDWRGRASDSQDAYLQVAAELAVGIGLQFSKVPIDLNAEIVPMLRILGHGGTDVGVFAAGGLNARYYF